MSISLRADNRIITKDGKGSFLLDNYSSGSSTLSINNPERIINGCFILVGNIGSSNTEILQVNAVAPLTGALTFINFSDVAITGTSATSIKFSKARQFYVGQTVTVVNGSTGAVRGSGTVTATGDSATMAISSVVGSAAGDIITVGDFTKYAHSESTKVTIIPFNKVRFFRTETPGTPNTIEYSSLSVNQNKSVTEKTISKISNPATTTYTNTDDPSTVTTVDYTPPVVFDGAVALTDIMDIQVSDFYTTISDTVNIDGYGWFAFYNTVTGRYSAISNPIPYGGFPENTVKKAFDTFDSSLNTKELKLITTSDRFSWINEAMAYMTNELNLGNWEYNSSEELTLTIKGGQAKYLLPQNFSDLLYINDIDGNKVQHYSATFQKSIINTLIKYIIRGRYLIFSPAPTVDTEFTLAYLKSSTTLKSLDDVLDLPNNAFYALKDFMRYRAYQKLGNSNESNSAFAMFIKQIDNMKIGSIKRDNGLDAWSIENCNNV